MPRVWNKRTDKIPPDAVYVGRPSKWGNPFEIRSIHKGKMMGRLDCIKAYEDWLGNQITAGLLSVEELRGKDLVCWCVPLPCHADFLLKLANQQK